MSILDLYSNEFRSRNQGHFSAIVRVAVEDGKISLEEKGFLDKLAVELEIPEKVYKDILKNPQAYPINPPVSQEKRIERLYDLSRMVCLDRIDRAAKRILLIKLVIGLGFKHTEAGKVVDKAMNLLADHREDFNTFRTAMENKPSTC